MKYIGTILIGLGIMALVYLLFTANNVDIETTTNQSTFISQGPSILVVFLVISGLGLLFAGRSQRQE